jgi:hypothetical protein
MYAIPHSQMNGVTPKIQMSGITQNADPLHEFTASISTQCLRKAVLNVFPIQIRQGDSDE